jgi:hypothetical protein
MNPEQIQAAIEGLLAVQRELQESQLKLLEQSKISERKLDRLIGYSITQESDILTVQEELIALKTRVSALEQQ